MLAFPQLTTGTLTQYPLLKRHSMRTIINTLGDGNSIKLADPCGEITEWQLQYAGLSDDEASALETFFAATEGGLRTFAFLDPTANLFAWSDRLDHSGWIKGPLLSIAGGLTDPMGGTNAWRLSNSGGAAQRLSQTLEAPGGYVFCLSAYVKSSVAATITLLRGSARADRALTAAWTRVALSASGDPLDETVECGIEVPAGGSLDLFGLQVEPQMGASAYKASTSGGIYPTAWFRDDTLALTATDVNRHSATVNIIHANRL